MQSTEMVEMNTLHSIFFDIFVVTMKKENQGLCQPTTFKINQEIYFRIEENKYIFLVSNEIEDDV